MKRNQIGPIPLHANDRTISICIRTEPANRISFWNFVLIRVERT